LLDRNDAGREERDLTPEWIRIACEEIPLSWSAKERRKRATWAEPLPVEIVAVSVVETRTAWLRIV